MRIGIDIDNVIVNTTETVLNYINERLPDIELKIENLKSYWIEDSLPPYYRWIVKLAFEQREMWKKVHIIDGAAEVIKKLFEEGHDIYFATATTAENFRKKVSFLEREFSFLPDDYVRQNAISIKHKQLLNLDVLVDDYLNNLTGERSYWSLCYDYPWNQQLTSEKKFVRVSNWDFIYKTIQQLQMGW